MRNTGNSTTSAYPGRWQICPPFPSTSIPFVKKGGYFIPYKSGKADKEIAQARSAVKKLGGEMKDIIVKVLPETDVERTFVPVKKMAITAKENIREKAGTSGEGTVKVKKNRISKKRKELQDLVSMDREVLFLHIRRVSRKVRKCFT